MKYLIRLDDACETMNFDKWKRIEKLFDRFNVKPLIAVIPNNQDSSMMIDQPNENFWEWVSTVESKRWEIGMHGYDHVYVTENGGINPIHNRSEFAGLSYEKQQFKIKSGFEILQKRGFTPRVFIAPSHTFDANTLKALEDHTSIRIISDTIALKPYKQGNFNFVPVQFGHVRKVPIPNSFITFCYHPNSMDEASFLELEKFLEVHGSKFIAFGDLKLEDLRQKTLIDRLYSALYFQFRKSFR